MFIIKIKTELFLLFVYNTYRILYDADVIIINKGLLTGVTVIRGKYSHQQKAATEKYLAANYERIQLRVRKGKKNRINELAKSQGMSTSAYILSLIEKDAERLNFDISAPPTPSQQHR